MQKLLAKQVLLKGGVISFATDTLFALACDATSDAAIEKLFALKKRPIEKTAPILVRSLEQAQSYAYFNDIALTLAKAFWPGALTLVLPVLEPTTLSGHTIREGTIGLRVPNSELSLNLIKEWGIPILGTSANIAGGPNLTTAEEIEAVFGNEALIIKSENKISGTASTILKIVGDEVFLIREGSIKETDLAPYLGNRKLRK
ncbi:MAG: putative yrdC protein [Candidatus Midichloriaceae bacterium]|jgi:L-threonylcarbamoyladenylate synthase|nr:putative yrdC protein [Candidatus Midichloriaceae bacterium]